MITGGFKPNLNRLRTKIGEASKQKVERIAQTIYDGVVRRSPVLRGNFRASWNVSEGYPFYKNEDTGKIGNPLAAPTYKVGAKSTYPVLYITNGRPYAQIIEKGSSTQAPYGVVRVTLASLR